MGKGEGERGKEGKGKGGKREGGEKKKGKPRPKIIGRGYGLASAVVSFGY